MADSQIPSVAIVGGGIAGWMAAAALANAFGGNSRAITLVDIPQAASAEMCDSSLPTIRTFNEKLGIAEDDFVRKTGATFKLGTEFAGWSAPNQSFFHPFGHYGTSIETVGFHHCWFKMRQLGDDTALAEYSLASVAASLGRFARPSTDTRSVLSSFSYGFQFDSTRYIDMLRTYAESRGVTRRPSTAVGAKLRGNDGFIDSLNLGGGAHLQADLYVDCSGACGILIEQALQAGYEDWSRWLPCDRAVVCQSEKMADPRASTRITAHDGGWQWRIPMQDHTNDGYVYSSRFVDDWNARTALLQNLDGPPASEPSLLLFSNGHRKKFWSKNCVALGAAAGFLEPLESTAIHLIQSGISRLLQLLPGGGMNVVDAEEYNRLALAEFEQIRDFLILHYHANGRPASPLWDFCRDMTIPDSLAFKMELFRNRGRVASNSGELFFLPNWLSIFAGMNILPRRYHPFADGLSNQHVTQQMKFMRTAIRQAAETMPRHAAFVAQTVGRAN